MTNVGIIQLPEVQLAQPEFRPIMAKRWRLRWRFDLGNGKRRVGIWDASSTAAVDAAWAIDKTGLRKAAIEAENVLTHELWTPLEMDGHDYAFCQWEAFARSPSLGNFDSVQLITKIAGLTMYTNDERLTVWVDGSITRHPLTDDERAFKFREHSAGT